MSENDKLENRSLKQDGQYPVTISGHASGSQVVLVSVAAGSFALILFPLYILANSNSLAATAQVALFFSMILGTGFLVAVSRMWHRSQPSVDQALQPPILAVRSEIMLKPDAITVTGDEKFMRGRAVQKFILEAMSRLHHQVPLPPAHGRIETDSTGALKAIPFTETEAAADAERLGKTVARDQQRLRAMVHSLPEMSRPSKFALQSPAQDSATAGDGLELPEASNELNLVPIDNSAKAEAPEKRRRGGKGQQD